MKWIKAYDIHNAAVLINLDDIGSIHYNKGERNVLTLVPKGQLSENIPILFFVFGDNIRPVLVIIDCEELLDA